VFDEDGTLRTYNASGEPIGELATGAQNPFVNTMDPSSGVLAVAADPGGVVVIDPASSEVEHLPGNDSVANLGFARDGQLLVITGFDGTVRVWDLVRGEPAGLVWDGTGVGLSSPSWYDESSDSIWVFSSGRLLEIPLDPQRWVERACDIVGRDLTSDEWGRYVPGDEDVQSACT
jgi:WD40 repeat protein